MSTSSQHFFDVALSRFEKQRLAFESANNVGSELRSIVDYHRHRSLDERDRNGTYFEEIQFDRAA